MVNELEEYLRIFKFLLNNEVPTAHPLYYHNLWLPDAEGHAGAILCELDSVEKRSKRESKRICSMF